MSRITPSAHSTPPIPAPASRPAIDDETYRFLCRIVYERSRIQLGSAKQELVASRVSKRLRQLGLSSFEAYCKFLSSPTGDQEVVDLINVISTNVTDFFREPSHFDFMQATILPEWMAGARRANPGPFRVWSAACSSGEEPYTIAMVLAEFARQHPSFSWQVEGSDISTRILERASAAIYPSDRVKLPLTEWLSRYFQKGIGQYAGYYRVKSELRDRVTFYHVNLFQPKYPIAGNLDVIFCRNVMIYFDRPTQEELIARLREQLRPGGYLVVGHSESLIGIRHGLKSVQPSIYRRM